MGNLDREDSSGCFTEMEIGNAKQDPTKFGGQESRSRAEVGNEKASPRATITANQILLRLTSQQKKKEDESHF